MKIDTKWNPSSSSEYAGTFSVTQYSDLAFPWISCDYITTEKFLIFRFRLQKIADNKFHSNFLRLEFRVIKSNNKDWRQFFIHPTSSFQWEFSAISRDDKTINKHCRTLREIDFQFANANPLIGKWGEWHSDSMFLPHLIELFAWF